MNIQDLTQLCHHLVRPLLAHGGAVVDATAGNGHDTEFLAGAVGPVGQVYALDAHEDAVRETLKRLEAAGLLDRVSVQLAGHEKLDEVLPGHLRGELSGFMFNLGYRPGGDKGFTTRTDTTLAALDAALRWLAPGGFISVVAYRGHAGGSDEAQAVADWIAALPPAEYETLRCDVPNAPAHAPQLFLARRQRRRLGA